MGVSVLYNAFSLLDFRIPLTGFQDGLLCLFYDSWKDKGLRKSWVSSDLGGEVGFCKPLIPLARQAWCIRTPQEPGYQGLLGRVGAVTVH